VNFKYSGVDANGAPVQGMIEAISLEEAKGRLRRNNILYSSIKEVRTARFKNISLFSRKTISNKELASLSRELAMYIKSGTTIVNAVKIVQKRYDNNKKIANFLENVATKLDEGKNFYQSLETQQVLTLPSFFKHAVKVSENGGILDDVLLELSRFLKEQSRIKEQMQSAFAYPAFMMTVAFAVVGFMLVYIVPKITAIFDQLDQALPGITVFVIDSGEFLTNYGTHLLAGLLGLLLLFIFFMQTSKVFKYRVDWLKLKIPFFGSLHEKAELARLSYIASMLLRSGVTLVQTSTLAANLLQNEVLKKLFLDAANRVVEGKKLSSALMGGSYKIDSTFTQTLAMGEETSQVQNVLGHMAELYFEEYRDRVGVMLSLLEPFLMLVVGGVVGFIVTAMLLPVFSLNLG
jgi:general secretion pathway protein F/type IV pilus assembly protein PilC